MEQWQFNIGKRYRPIRYIGNGAYGQVAEYFDQQQNKKVAIKKLNSINDLQDAKRILRELKIQHCMNHPNILRLDHVICVPNNKFYDIYLVSEVWDSDLCKLIIYSLNELSPQHIQYIIYQVFLGVFYLHSAQIIHRDIKPSNVLINENCEVAICDFGFARQISHKNISMTEYVVTRYYRAPEVILSSCSYGRSMDIWSVGCTLYELLKGQPLFKAKNYIELMKKIVSVLGPPS